MCFKILTIKAFVLIPCVVGSYSPFFKFSDQAQIKYVFSTELIHFEKSTLIAINYAVDQITYSFRPLQPTSFGTIDCCEIFSYSYFGLKWFPRLIEKFWQKFFASLALTLSHFSKHESFSYKMPMQMSEGGGVLIPSVAFDCNRWGKERIDWALSAHPGKQNESLAKQ